MLYSKPATGPSLTFSTGGGSSGALAVKDLSHLLRCFNTELIAFPKGSVPIVPDNVWKCFKHM